MRVEDRPLLRATAKDLAVAPELAVLCALDAVLATAAYQLFVAHADLGIDKLARGDPPDPAARKASFVILHIGEMRTMLRDYRNFTLHGNPDDDTSF